jgi:L,D-transpeptidase ErfK/SrfK
MYTAGRLTNKFYVVLLLLILSNPLTAGTYLLPENPKDSLIGESDSKKLFTTTTKKDDTLLDVARRFDLGQNEILLLNPNVDRWLPGEGTVVQLPNRRILPDAPRNGVVLNLPEFRLYFFPKSKKGEPKKVITHPISIGRQDWNTPLGTTRVIQKIKNPVWRPPASIKAEHAAKGDPLPDVVPAGPDNPLGLYKITLGIPGYLIHSTNKPYGVGMRVSHGCIRMYPEDIEKFFPEIPIGTPVHIVNQPIKVGWLNNMLYIEVHPELEGEGDTNYADLLEKALNLIEQANGNKIPVLDGAALRRALEKQNGKPVAIFHRPEEVPEIEANL